MTITPQNLYFDPKAREINTKVTKPKYKLLIAQLSGLDMFVFIAGTSKDYRASYNDCIKCEPSDWDDIQTAHMNDIGQKDGYFSWKHSCQNNKNTILKYFSYAAKLKNERFKELMEVGTVISKNCNMFSQPHIQLAQIVTAPISDTEKIKNRLGI